ncbi:MAG TPA: phosphonate utilization associated transcriptional regulator [Burkholderiales bacterium]|nr:phosphonate utilization associated transcriptional regulator [Burkholderiales bacterium]
MNSPAAPSPLELVQSNSLPMLVAREVERMILAGELSVGERVNESALAARFRVSRGPVREALRGLEESGLLRLEKNRGVFVREISLAEADEIYDLREALDELVGERLAKRFDPAARKAVHALLDEMDRASAQGDAASYHMLNLRFHDALVDATGNAKLIATYRRLIKELHLFRLKGLTIGGGLPVSNDEHRAIVKAIEAGEADVAGKRMRDHVRASRKRMHKGVK